MVEAKSIRIKLFEASLIIFFFVFPFGQLLRLSLQVLNFRYTLQPLDLSILLISICGMTIVSDVKLSKIKSLALSIVIFLFFSSFFNLFYLKINIKYFLLGFFYLLRLINYFLFFLAVRKYLVLYPLAKIKLYELFLIDIFFVAFLGLLQYIWFPDLRVLKNIGWDDHYYRLVGTFLDPTYIGLLMVFGYILSFFKAINTEKYKITYIFLTLFFIITLSLTFSRASYLSLLPILIYPFLKSRKYISLSLFSIAIIVILPLILPRYPSEGVKLERLYSVYSRLDNYKNTLNIFKTSPILGIGYDNICYFRFRSSLNDSSESHSCSGSDSSFLFLIATGGMLGTVLFGYLFYYIYQNIGQDFYSSALKVSFFSLIIHSSFSNSMFYLWVAAYFSIMSALSLKNNNPTSSI